VPGPQFWILAGPNGSGKSTFAQSEIFGGLSRTPESPNIVHLNPDERARSLRESQPHLGEGEIALRAAQQSDAALDQLIAGRRSVLVETILSSDKFKPRVEQAKRLGFEIVLTYLFLRYADINVARVAQRVAMGGHGVEPQRIRDRWRRSLANLGWFAERADVLTVWDNTRAAGEGPPELVIAATRAGRYVNREAEALSLDADPFLRGCLSAVIERLA
jgi:predicted ABC-type ATPase